MCMSMCCNRYQMDKCPQKYGDKSNIHIGIAGGRRGLTRHPIHSAHTVQVSANGDYKYWNAHMRRVSTRRACANTVRFSTSAHSAKPSSGSSHSDAAAVVVWRHWLPCALPHSTPLPSVPFSPHPRKQVFAHSRALLLHKDQPISDSNKPRRYLRFEQTSTPTQASCTNEQRFHHHLCVRSGTSVLHASSGASLSIAL